MGILAFLLVFLIAAYMILRSSEVQTYLTSEISAYLQKKYNVDVDIKGVDIEFFNRIVLENIKLNTNNGDTLVYVRKLRSNVEKIRLKNKKIELENIELHRVKFNYYADSISSNLERFINAFSHSKSEPEKPDDDKPNWNITCRNLSLHNSAFTYNYNNARDTSSKQMNYENIRITGINIDLTDIAIKDSITFRIKKMKLKEACGFQINELSAHTAFLENEIRLRNLTLITENSNIKANYFRLLFQDFGAFSDFVKKVGLEGDFVSPSKLGLRDLAYFSETLEGLNQYCLIEGHVKGRIPRLKAKNLKLEYGKNTKLLTDVEINGLPEIEQTHFHFNTKYLTTTKRDIESFYLYPFQNQENIELPEIVGKLGTIRYKGIFLGLLDDFFIKGNFSTALGTIAPYMRLKPDTMNQTTHFDGKLAAKGFKLGQLIGVEDLGKLTFNFSLKGKRKKGKKTEAKIKGQIKALEYKNYEYKNVNLSGFFSEDTVNYSVLVEEENLNLDIKGKLNLANETPKLYVNANLKKANLAVLHLDKDTISLMKGRLKIDVTGNNPDNFLGSVNLKEMQWQRSEGGFRLKKFDVEFDTIDAVQKRIAINSDIIDAELSGKCRFSSIYSNINTLFYSYLPVFQSDSLARPKTRGNDNDFVFSIYFNDTENVMKTLMPEMRIAQGSEILGALYEKDNFITMRIKSPRIEFYGQVIEDLTIENKGIDSTFFLNMYAKKYFIAESNGIETFSLKAEISENQIPFVLHWDNYDAEYKNKGTITATTIFSSNNNKPFPMINCNFEPSDIYIGNKPWKLSKSSIVVDSTAISFSDFRFTFRENGLKINGKISEIETDTLNIDVLNLNLETLNFLLARSGHRFSGIMNGKNQLVNFYKSPKVISYDSISMLKINNHRLGNMILESFWNDENQKIMLNTSFHNNRQEKTFELQGFYQPEDNKIDFELNMDRFMIAFASDFLKEYVTDLRGMISTNAFKIKGTTTKPELSGMIKLQKTSFLVNYLQTKYSFTDSVYVENNAFVFNELKLFDSRGDSAYLDGDIKHTHFSDITLNLGINANKFMFLNTNVEDNELYYGKAFASGLIHVQGTTDNIVIRVDAKTEKDTEFFIPLTSASEVSEKNFITFVNTNITDFKEKKSDNYEVDLTGIQLDLNLEITPEAEAQIILDETIGDIIKGSGSGNLELDIDTKGDFEMRGAFEIEKGNYMFTLPSVISKKFDVEKGGTITWTGDPYNARIDLNAVYRLKKIPLYDLLLDEDYRETKLPVNCKIGMTDKLMSPKIRFKIEVDENDDRINSQLQNLPSDELNKQFLSLLVINRFQPLPGMGSGVENRTSDINLGANAGELLTGQLTHWLSQISDDFDIGVQYHASDTISSGQVEVALSTQLLNDRMVINGNLNYGGQQTNTSNLVGEFDIEYKITKNGKLRVKYYNKANNNLIYESAPYKQGVGLFYKKDFNHFREIFQRDVPRYKRKKENDKKKEKKSASKKKSEE